MKSQNNADNLVAVFGEYTVLTESISIYDAIDGSEVKTIMKDERILTSQKCGDWMYTFYPWGGWIKTNDKQAPLERTRFLKEEEIFSDFTDPGNLTDATKSFATLFLFLKPKEITTIECIYLGVFGKMLYKLK